MGAPMTIPTSSQDTSLAIEGVGPAAIGLAPASRPRIFLNRLLFRGMLFTMGTIAVVLYRVLPDKRPTWRFAKAQARNLLRLCGVRVRVRGLDKLASGPYIFAPNHQSH